MTLTFVSLGRLTMLCASALAFACGALPKFGADEVTCRAAVAPDGDVLPGAVQWYYIDDSGDRSFQNAWCAGVGPAVVREAPEPVGAELAEDDRPAAGGRVVRGGSASTVERDSTLPEEAAELPVLDSLLIVAYNAHIGAGDLDRLVDDIRGGGFTGEPITHFVLLLQEVHRSGLGVPSDEDLVEGTPSGSRTPNPDRTSVVDWAESLHLHLFYAPSMRNGIGFDVAEDRGNAVMSTLPLHELRALELPQGIQRRVALVAEVRGRTSEGVPWELDVSSAHLDNASLSNPLASLGAARARQASGLVRMLPDEGALVVGGDFNTWFRQTEERAYRTMRLHFPYPREHQMAPTVDRLGEGRVIDWIFFRGPQGWTFDDARAASMYGSDHFPVYGWVHIPPGGSAD